MSRQSVPQAPAYCMLTSQHTLLCYTKTNAHLHAQKRAGEEMESDGWIETGANHEETCQRVWGMFKNILQLWHEQHWLWSKKEKPQCRHCCQNACPNDETSQDSWYITQTRKYFTQNKMICTAAVVWKWCKRHTQSVSCAVCALNFHQVWNSPSQLL